MRYQDLFKKNVPNLTEPNSNGECMGQCPFHANNSETFSCNLITGKWNCFACDKKGGPRVFRNLVGGDRPKELELVPADEIDHYHEALFKSPKALKFLTETRHIPEDTLRQFKIGWDGERYWIPIKDEEGKWVNVRKHKPNHHGNDKVIHYKKGYGKARFYPIENLKKPGIKLVLEGELDTLLAISMGFIAITQTAGAKTWKPEFTRAFAGEDVWVCYDADNVGREYGPKVASAIAKVAASVHLLDLGPVLDDTDGNDFTDYVAQGATADDFKALIGDTQEAAKEFGGIAEPSAEVIEVPLSESSLSDYTFKRVKTKVIVAGKDLSPYTVPKKVLFKCIMGEDRCIYCPIAAFNGEMEFEFKEWYQQLLEMINSSNAGVESALAKGVGVPGKCRKFDFEVIEYVNIELLKTIPDVDYIQSLANAEERESAYTLRTLYYMGHGIEANRAYEIVGVSMPEPKSQYATVLIYEVEPAMSNIESFSMTPELLEQLKAFQP